MSKQQLRFGVAYLGNNLKNKKMTFTEELQKRQNDKNNIKRLAAQRRIYSKAKEINYLIYCDNEYSCNRC